MTNDKIMLGVPVGDTFRENMEFNLYEDAKKADYAYLGLYKDKAIRAVGKVLKIVKVKSDNGELTFDTELTADEKERFLAYRDRCLDSDCPVEESRTRIFFVDKFYRTNYRNVGATGIVGGKKFLLDNLLAITSSTEELAAQLDGQTWQLEKGKDIIPDKKIIFRPIRDM